MKKRILIVEDNDINRIMLSGIVSAEYETVETVNGKEALEVLEQQWTRISLILLDIVMPVMNGYEFLDEMKKNENYASIPVIVTTERSSEAEEIRALSCGATEFVVKPYQPAIILHRIASILKLHEASAMVYQLQYDRLTGLYSKDYFYQFARDLKRRNPDKVYDIICSNIENFHLFNDKFGTEAGDYLLKELANVYRDILPDDTAAVAHFYADHFIAIVEHQEKYENFIFAGVTESLRRSIGVPSVVLKWGIYTDNGEEDKIEKMCDNATLAARSIKGQYGTYFAHFDRNVKEMLKREQLITEEMEQALAEGQFSVYLQPKVKRGSEKLTDAEALVRWNHPERGLVSPGVFIPIFEKNRFIGRLDRYVWEQVCRMLRHWADEGLGEISVSVNVSRVDIYDQSLLEVLMELVQRYQIQPYQLHLEVTETACTENENEMIELVSKLRKHGFVIEMDDFGSGYSSLNLLTQMPIDIVKLDRTLIQSEMKNPGGLSYIIGLAHWMKMKVVAEGVETKEQFDHMRKLGCDYVQGYYTAYPMPQTAFEQLLREQTETRNWGGGKVMSIREFYEQLGEDYDEVLRRMMGKESFAAMLLRSFLQDQTYGNLSQAMHGGSTEDIFEQSHTLKGVAANLGLKPLYDKTAVLVELTRAGILEGADEAFAGIKKEYETILGLLEQIEFAEGV